MILESPLDDLMEEIGGKDFMNIRPRKVIGKWLDDKN
jgi:hypothetical protein